MYRMKGTSKRKGLSLGEYPFMHLGEARKLALKALSKAAEGIDPGNPDAPDTDAYTFEKLSKEYIERYAKIEKRSWKADLRGLENDVLPTFGKTLTSELTRKDVITLLNSIKDRGAWRNDRGQKRIGQGQHL